MATIIISRIDGRDQYIEGLSDAIALQSARVHAAEMADEGVTGGVILSDSEGHYLVGAGGDLTGMTRAMWAEYGLEAPAERNLTHEDADSNVQVVS